MKSFKSSAIVLGLLALGTAASAAVETYKIQPAHSSVNFTVKRFFTKIPGAFATFSGTITVDRDNLENSSTEATIQVGSVDTNDDKRDAHLQTQDFFLTEKFPAIAFKSTSWKKAGPDTYDVAGELTIKGVTKPVVLKTKVLGFGKGARGSDIAGFEGTTTINRTDFGIDFGKGVIGDEVAVDINIESTKQEPAKTSSVAAPAFIPEGVWRGEFDVSEEKIPFNFEVKGRNAEEAVFTLINGSRRDDFHVRQETDGSYFVKMNTYDAALVAKLESDGRLTGVYKSLIPNRGSDLPFTAERGKSWRFVEPGHEVAPKGNLSGKWSFKVISKDKTLNNVAILKQDGNRLTGVTLAITGDSRELEGVVQGDEFFLSHFSGPSPRIYKGKINEDGSITGVISRGIYDNIKFEGVKDEHAELPDLYKLTYLKEGQKSLDFVLPDLDGKPVSLKDEKYKGKVVIVEVIGTWCPNCTDQTVFLSPWFRANKQRGVEAIAVGFEQKDDLEYAKYTLGTLKKKYGIEYDIVFGGIADKKVATEKLKGINYLAAFPTTFIIDRKGEVRQIFTGYTGTVTDEYYKEYVTKFNALLDELIAEPNPYAGKTATLQSAALPVTPDKT